MRMISFARRCAKEILRDPLTLGFGLGFPLILLLLLSAIHANIPANAAPDIYEINQLTPGISIFGLSFMTLFSATLIARDRETSFLQRLYTTPLTGMEFILGYMLPIFPIALAQTILCYLCAIPSGLNISIHIFYVMIGMIPIAVFYIAMGLLFGSILNVKQVGGICGALLTNLSAWLSGVWFDLDLLGDTFGKIANFFPFVHAVEMEKALFHGNFETVPGHLLPVILYSIFTTILAVLLFLRQMKKQ